MNEWNFGAGERTQFFRALAILAEDLGSVPSAYMTDSMHLLELQLEVICCPLLASMGSAHLYNAGITLIHRKKSLKNN